MHLVTFSLSGQLWFLDSGLTVTNNGPTIQSLGVMALQCNFYHVLIVLCQHLAVGLGDM